MSDSHTSPFGEHRPSSQDSSAGGRWLCPPGGSAGKRPRPPKLYRIGEVVEFSGLSRQTIHNYTTMGLLCESDRTRSGHRLFDESVFDRLDAIVRMKQEHRSLGFIREYFAQAEDGRHGREPIGKA
ncbi:MAG: MerR family transcriptional regulator [Phycisphaerae bacterium]|nr:MerR family transcriptional regulator [Phycisphaerae bacterium]